MTERNQPKITILSERKIIDVKPGWLRGSQDRIEVDVCVTCGSVVFDVVLHDTWHREQENTREETP